MSPDALTQLILDYRYWILIPLCFLEGPIVAFVAGTLAAVGYFNMYALFAVFFIRDVAMDGFYYYLGRYARGWSFTKRLLDKIGLDEPAIAAVRRLWRKRPATTMFFSKLSYGIASTFVAIAGMVEVPIRTFYFYAALIAVLHYGTLLIAGYYFGNTFGSLPHILQNLQYGIAVIAIVITGYYLMKRYMNKNILVREEREGGE